MLDRERDVHHVPDYMGTGGKQEKLDRINDIINICKEHGYTHVFAGYGFMSENPDLAELVCSNSMGSMQPNKAPGLLKAEMRGLGSLILACAERSAVPPPPGPTFRGR